MVQFGDHILSDLPSSPLTSSHVKLRICSLEPTALACPHPRILFNPANALSQMKLSNSSRYDWINWLLYNFCYSDL
jgi:hypothetical protein